MATSENGGGMKKEKKLNKILNFKFIFLSKFNLKLAENYNTFL
jgi:hypothetical protein